VAGSPTKPARRTPPIQRPIRFPGQLSRFIIFVLVRQMEQHRFEAPVAHRLARAPALLGTRSSGHNQSVGRIFTQPGSACRMLPGDTAVDNRTTHRLKLLQVSRAQSGRVHSHSVALLIANDTR